MPSRADRRGDGIRYLERRSLRIRRQEALRQKESTLAYLNQAGRLT